MVLKRDKQYVLSEVNLEFLSWKTPLDTISRVIEEFFFLTLFIFFNFYFYFILLYNTVLVLPHIDMNPPQVYKSSQTWTSLPPPSILDETREENNSNFEELKRSQPS